eukprot:GHRR01007717.1.p3 GENE.GHRR01007717.1~~GHRR01007717.1.p3  ORF type:complete len:114 (-),score=46.28 GHRR01007717.1:3204-3545(-)
MPCLVKPSPVCGAAAVTVGYMGSKHVSAFCYCSVNELVLNTPANPLLIVNQRLQLVMAERKKQRAAQQQQQGGQKSRAVSAKTPGAGSPQPVLNLQGAGLLTLSAASRGSTAR